MNCLHCSLEVCASEVCASVPDRFKLLQAKEVNLQKFHPSKAPRVDGDQSNTSKETRISTIKLYV